MKKAFILACLCISLGGCIDKTEVIYLAKPGATNVSCGPYGGDFGGSQYPGGAPGQLRDCVADFQRSGYQRIAGPN